VSKHLVHLGVPCRGLGDAASIPTGGLLGTPDPQQFLGSFDMKWERVGSDSKGNPVIEFHLTNATTRASGNPSWVKVTNYPEGSAGDGHDAAPGENWLQQSVRWQETVVRAKLPSPSAGPSPMP
jgi:hypothetical protein